LVAFRLALLSLVAYPLALLWSVSHSLSCRSTAFALQNGRTFTLIQSFNQSRGGGEGKVVAMQCIMGRRVADPSEK